VRATKQHGLLTIRAEVIVVDDIDANLLAVLMNESQGKRPSTIEEGLWIQKMRSDYGWSQAQVAARLKKSQQWVSQRLKLVENLGQELKQGLTTRVVTVSQAREIAELLCGVQGPVVKKVADDHLTFLETQSLVHRVKEHPESLNACLSLEKNELASPPVELATYEAEYPEPKFESYTCPGCGQRVLVNWVLHRINWVEGTS
jgi:ParB family chromosome partitioning protein